MLGLVDRSDEVVIGMTGRVAKVNTVHRMQAGSVRRCQVHEEHERRAWQPNPAEAAEGEPFGMAMALVVSVPLVSVEHTPAVPVMEPRDYKVRFYIQREVELAKCGFTDGCKGCRVAQVGAEAKPHGEGCRERIRQSMMNDEVGPQRLYAAEQRVAPTGETTVSGHTSRSGPGGPDEEIKERSACSEQREERQTQNGREQPNGGRCCGRESEDHLRWVRRTTAGSRQLTSRRWASARWQWSSCHWVWHRRIPKGPTCSAETELVTQLSAWAFEHGFVVEYATGWNVSDEEQMEKVE